MGVLRRREVRVFFLLAGLHGQLGGGEGGDVVLAGVGGGDVVAAAVGEVEAEGLAGPPLRTVASLAVMMWGDAGLVRSAMKTWCQMAVPLAPGMTSWA